MQPFDPKRFQEACAREYQRGYRDGLAGVFPEHIKGKPEPFYRPVAHPHYCQGHKDGRAKRNELPRSSMERK